jgi:predicted ATPase/DNA-binding winged helix-turn-helix (wHTH) protein
LTGSDLRHKAPTRLEAGAQTFLSVLKAALNRCIRARIVASGERYSGRSMNSMSAATYRFLTAEMQTAQRMLRVDGRECQVGTRAFDLLLALIERRDRVVSKSELLDIVWSGTVVEESNLPVQVSSLRKLLGPQAIATIPGRGYRFVAPLLDAAAEREADEPSSPAPDAYLLTAPPALFGRDDEVALLTELLRTHRLVTVVGAGGIGKSRLAQVVSLAQARHFRDGVSLIELAGLGDPALIGHALAQSLGLSVPDGDAGVRRLADALASRQMLLVLDNCEHLVEPLAVIVERLLDGAPELRVLATSQEPLRVPSEQQLRLEPLLVPHDASVPGARGYGALVLFESRVRAASHHFEIAEADLPIAIDLCRQLDGLPLAIELAAARVPLLGVRIVHARLRERFLLLTAGARTALRRHQTLRAALDWSHGLLDEPQRAVFRRLGVFSGGFTVELAQGVCADDEHDEWVVLEQLAALVDKSLVVADPADPVRYRLLESTRAFALEQLAGANETASLMRRHAETMLAFLRRADDGNMDSTLRSDEYAALVLPELDNLRTAYASACDQFGNRALATGLAAHAGPLINHSTEFAAWLIAQHPYVTPGAVDAATAARYWRANASSNMLGLLTISDLLAAAQRAVAAYRELRRPRRLFAALRLAAIWQTCTDDVDGARASIDEATALIEPDWPAEFRILALRFHGWVSRVAGNHEAARLHYAESIALARKAQDWRLEVIERYYASDLRWEIGQRDEAAHDLSELLDALRQRPATNFELIEVMSTRIGILGESGRIDEAAIAAGETLPVMRRMPKFRFESYAQLLWRLGRTEAAARVLGALTARQREGREQRQINESRVAHATFSGLQMLLPAPRLSVEMASGEGLREPDVCGLVAEAIGLPSR